MGDQLLMQLVAELFSPLGSPRPLFRMSLYFFKPVRVTHDLEIETPVIVYASLPQVTSVIVPFFAKGWVVKIAGKKSKLFTKGPSNSGRSIFQRIEHPVGKVDFHRLAYVRFFAAACLRRKLALIDAIASAAVSNGP
jgi:hypothetical protein